MLSKPFPFHMLIIQSPAEYEGQREEFCDALPAVDDLAEICREASIPVRVDAREDNDEIDMIFWGCDYKGATKLYSDNRFAELDELHHDNPRILIIGGLFVYSILSEKTQRRGYYAQNNPDQYATDDVQDLQRKLAVCDGRVAERARLTDLQFKDTKKSAQIYVDPQASATWDSCFDLRSYYRFTGSTFYNPITEVHEGIFRKVQK